MNSPSITLETLNELSKGVTVERIIEALDYTLRQGITRKALAEQLARWPRVFGDPEEYIHYLFRERSMLSTIQFKGSIYSKTF